MCSKDAQKHAVQIICLQMIWTDCYRIYVQHDLFPVLIPACYFLFQLDGLEKSFYSFYVCTAVRKFFFFLDPLRTGEGGNVI